MSIWKVSLSFVVVIALALCGGPRLSADSPTTIGEIQRIDDAVNALLSEDVEIEVLAEGFDWSEGPVWVPRDGGYLLFSDVPRNHILQWKEDACSVFLEESGILRNGSDDNHEPGSNGLALDSDGRLIICQHGERQICRLEADGSRTPLASRFEGKRFNSPNDLVIHSSGAIYFTDPAYGLPNRFDDPAREIDFCGVYRCDVDGNVTLVSRELSRPNGIGLSPDERSLYVSNSDRANPIILVFSVQDDGSFGESRVFFDPRKQAGYTRGAHDGMAIDEQGNLWATGSGSVRIISPQGDLLGRIATGQATANCTFGGEDGSILFITADNFLCRVQTSTRGVRWSE